MDIDFFCGEIDIPSFSCEVIGAFSIDVDGRKSGGNLHDSAPKCRKRSFYLFALNMAVIGGGNDFAFDIVGRSSLPEFEVGDVSFVTSKKIPQKSRGFSDGNDEEP